MAYESWFDTDENRALLAICTRRLIKNIGIGAVIWGVLNMGLGIFWMQFSMLNVCVLILGVAMLGSGVGALVRPSLGCVLTAAVLALFLLAWNGFISVLNVLAGKPPNIWIIIVPLIITIGFFRQYMQLQHLSAQIAAVQPDELKRTKDLCKSLLKKKLKEEPNVVQTSDRAMRVQLMPGRAFFTHRNMLRAFAATVDEVRAVTTDPNAKTLKMVIRHPIEKMTLKFDKKNTEKIRNWLAAAAETPAAAPPPLPPA